MVPVWSSNMAAYFAPPPDTKEKGDPDLVILIPSRAAEGSPGGLVSKWESLQHYSKQALLTNAWGCSLFPWCAQDFLPPRNPRRPGSTGREISAQHAPSFRNLCVPLGSRLLCFVRDTGWQGVINKGISPNKLPTRKHPALTAGQGDLTQMLSRGLLSPQRHQGPAWEAPSVPRHHQQAT